MQKHRKKHKKHNGMTRYAILRVKPVIDIVKSKKILEQYHFQNNIELEDSKVRIELSGYSVSVSSLRLRTFAFKGTKCKICGLRGRFFAIERHNTGIINENRYHLNLYGIDEEGDEVLFTRDHIVPKSARGPNRLDNSQTLCKVCNEVKGGDQY